MRRYRTMRGWAVHTDAHAVPTAVFCHRGDALDDLRVMKYGDEQQRWWLERCTITIVDLRKQRTATKSRKR